MVTKSEEGALFGNKQSSCVADNTDQCYSVCIYYHTDGELFRHTPTAHPLRARPCQPGRLSSPHYRHPFTLGKHQKRLLLGPLLRRTSVPAVVPRSALATRFPRRRCSPSKRQPLTFHYPCCYYTHRCETRSTARVGRSAEKVGKGMVWGGNKLAVVPYFQHSVSFKEEEETRP